MPDRSERANGPISPPPVTVAAPQDLPAYISNGLVGLRVLDIPLLPGVALVNGFAGLHPTANVDAAAEAPYPVAGDLSINGAWLRQTPQQAEFTDQAIDFATGELTTRFTFTAGGIRARVAVLTVCSKKQPTLVLQEVAVEVDGACDLILRAMVDRERPTGRLARRDVQPPAGVEKPCDGALLWESLGGHARCGVAHATELLGDGESDRRIIDFGDGGGLATEYRIRARAGRTYRLRQIASLVPSVLHQDPDRQAVRLASRAAADGFDGIREESRLAWSELWRGRVRIDADDERWQALADAAFFYLNASVHPSSPSSTSIFGLAQWRDYHYYYGHVMWDIDLFCVPPLVLLQPDAARSLLEFRSRTLQAAESNARLYGRRGLQFPWESGPLHGEEAAPEAGRASWHEDHVSLDVAWAFAQYAHGTGDERFLRESAEPVLAGVSDWLASRVSRTSSGFALKATMGIAETTEPVDNEAYTLMAAITVLREAVAAAERVGRPVATAWQDLLAGLRIETLSESGAVRSHDGYRPNEWKGATPGPLAGVFPLWFDLPPDTERATLDYFLKLVPGYIGSPMLSALYVVWAAWQGNRRLARRLLDDGYAELIAPRFLQTLEQSPTKYPEKPRSGPFFANLGGFLMSLLYGLPGIRLGPGNPSEWPSRPVVLPEGWRSIEVDRAWIRGEPARIVARQGDARATVEAGPRRRRRAA